MASTSGASLAHRSVSNIRAGGVRSPGGSGAGAAGPSSPHTPLRTISSTFGSPSSLRAEEDTIIIELGARKVQVGFAGDPVPKAVVTFGPEQQRRVGDFRAWQPGGHADDDWRKRGDSAWGRDHELWQLDVRGLDLGLVEDKLERGLREAFSKYLLMDSRPRKMTLVLPPALPLPLLSTTLDTLFNRFQSPLISLTSSAVMCVVGAGTRSALIVDFGWAETVVTSVYEYREVHCSRSVRGGRMLMDRVHRLFAGALGHEGGPPTKEDAKAKPQSRHLSFEECEEIATRMLWCKTTASSSGRPGASSLPTVAEQDEDQAASSEQSAPAIAQIPLKSTTPPTTITLSYDQLTEPCESTFFEAQYSATSWDDHELPISLLIYHHLLHLPMDVRAICMSRLIFTGGCANVLGLRKRIFNEVSQLIETRGWDPVQGKGVEQLRANTKLQRRGSRPAGDGPTPVPEMTSEDGPAVQPPWPPNPLAEFNNLEQEVQRYRETAPLRVRGQLRAVESLGAWSGASLLTQLKVPAIATIDRELWLQHGAAGASRPSDVDFKTQQRQSLGAGGLMRSAAAGTNWTLGAWGSS
ncbi:uncharacterized protein E0L32_008453 [Thyridium curvatum]|uniref:Uncharacterized protein n=1 Tax=Thyridium curvatum TaxID=1093900 RepID=A0A507ASX6_9PEZI|nr:uncharacterized protein E0L32_008453 [Thyridium curvatum]TPX10567.1 hypothetical protein E0L32_008453 [Thyridium curvatum]